MRFLLPVLMLCISLSACHPTYMQIPEDGLADFLSADNPDLPNVSAHRGGRFYPECPENSMKVFRHVLRQARSVLEIDVQMSRDSVLFLLHDDELDRTTTGHGIAGDLTWKELSQLRLRDDFNTVTNARIPSLKKVLTWAEGKTILAIDLKADVPEQAVIDLIREVGAEDYALLICYSLEEAIRIHEKAPDLVLSVDMSDASEVAAHSEAGIPPDLCVAFTGTRLSDSAFYEEVHHRGIPTILGTMYEADPALREGDTTRHFNAFRAGVQIFATDYPVEVDGMIKRWKEAGYVGRGSGYATRRSDR